MIRGFRYGSVGTSRYAIRQLQRTSVRPSVPLRHRRQRCIKLHMKSTFFSPSAVFLLSIFFPPPWNMSVRWPLLCKQSSEKWRRSKNRFDGTRKIKYLGFWCCCNIADVFSVESDGRNIVRRTVYLISAYFSTDIFLPFGGSKRLDVVPSQQLRSFDDWTLASDDHRRWPDKRDDGTHWKCASEGMRRSLAADVGLNPQTVH